MKILILDDIEHRHNVFIDRYLKLDPTNIIVNTYSYSEFVKAWLQSDWDLVHLDHDLGDFYHSPDTYLGEDGNIRFYNGQDAVNKIIEDVASGKKKPQVIIHSINGTPSPWMLHDLKKAGFEASWQPFTEDNWFVYVEE